MYHIEPAGLALLACPMLSPRALCFALVFCLKFLIMLEQGHTRSFCTRPGELGNQPGCPYACLRVCVGVSHTDGVQACVRTCAVGGLGRWMRGGHHMPEGPDTAHGENFKCRF